MAFYSMADPNTAFDYIVENMNETMLNDAHIPFGDMLDLYGMKMQATEGDCTGERPPKLRVKERAKYDAWCRISEKHWTTAETKKAFVDKVKALNLDAQIDEDFV